MESGTSCPRARAYYARLGRSTSDRPAIADQGSDTHSVYSMHSLTSASAFSPASVSRAAAFRIKCPETPMVMCKNSMQGAEEGSSPPRVASHIEVPKSLMRVETCATEGSFQTLETSSAGLDTPPIAGAPNHAPLLPPPEGVARHTDMKKHQEEQLLPPTALAGKANACSTQQPVSQPAAQPSDAMSAEAAETTSLSTYAKLTKIAEQRGRQAEINAKLQAKLSSLDLEVKGRFRDLRSMMEKQAQEFAASIQDVKGQLDELCGRLEVQNKALSSCVSQQETPAIFQHVLGQLNDLCSRLETRVRGPVSPRELQQDIPACTAVRGKVKEMGNLLDVPAGELPTSCEPQSDIPVFLEDVWGELDELRGLLKTQANELLTPELPQDNPVCLKEVSNDLETLQASVLPKAEPPHLSAPVLSQEPPSTSAKAPTEAEGITLVYYTTWPRPCIHCCIGQGQDWTQLPGMPLRPSGIEGFPAREGGGGWFEIGLPAVRSLEFALNDGVPEHWDKPPSGANYQVHRPGLWVLHGGSVREHAPGVGEGAGGAAVSEVAKVAPEPLRGSPCSFAAEKGGVLLLYRTSWPRPHLHFCARDAGPWTAVPGKAMAGSGFDGFPHAEGWRALHIPDAAHLEFVPNDGGARWDKAPGNTNFQLAGAGAWRLVDGSLERLDNRP